MNINITIRASNTTGTEEADTLAILANADSVCDAALELVRAINSLLHDTGRNNVYTDVTTCTDYRLAAEFRR